MSNPVYTKYVATYTIFAGTIKSFQSQIIDPLTNKNIDMTNTVLYNSGYVDIFDGIGNLISKGITIVYTNRVAGTSYVSWVAGPFTTSQAGNFKGIVFLTNTMGQIIDQQEFNFIIKESR